MKSPTQKDDVVLQTADRIKGNSKDAVQPHEQILNEIHDMNHDQEQEKPQLTDQVSRQLQKIFEVQHNEVKGYHCDLPTSFAIVETEIAKCIAECLSDYPEQRRSIPFVLSLLKDYKVLVPVQGQNPSISLDKLYSILQDNFQDSYLCGLFNYFLAGRGNLQTKVITLF